MGDAAGLAYSEEAPCAADLPAKSVYMIALPVPGTDTRVLTGRDQLLGQRSLIRIDRHRRVRPLVWVHADHHHRHDLPLSSHSRQKGTAADMSYYGSVIVAPLTSHTHHPGHPGRWRVAGLRQ